MSERGNLRGGPQNTESWRNDIPLPPAERQSIPSLMDPPEIVEMRKNIEEHRQKIVDSEQNLQAHRNGMDELLAVHLKSAIRAAETLKIDRMLSAQNLNVEEFNLHLEALSAPKCSKDLISNAKKWIFENCTSDQLREIILTYLLNRVKDDSSGEFLRLHILYLINDWAFHCQRKKEDNQMKMLARYVPKMYAYCIELSTSSELSDKLEGKLLGEWEGRGYFADSVFKQLRNTVQIVSTDREIENSSYGSIRESIRSNLMATFDAYEQQHITYSQHVQSQIDELERGIDEFRYGYTPSRQQNQAPSSSNLRKSRFDQAPTERFAAKPPETQTWRTYEERKKNEEDIDGTPFDENNLKPQKSYLALPAGIMTPLVSMNSFLYEPIDPEALEMPPHVQPSQRLLSAKNMFHKGVEMDMIAADGVLGADSDFLNYPADFLDKKAQFRKDFLKNQLCSLEELITNKPTAADKERFDKERKQKESEQTANIRSTIDAYYADQDPDQEEPRRRSISRSPSRERRSESRSPERRASSRSSESSDSSRSSRSSSSSSSSRRSVERDRRSFGASSSFDRPSFGAKSANEPLSADNKGAQLMAKMGWTSGKGLGSNETGIIDPVSGGEVRDRNEKFIGFGRTLDPYEQFRKQRSGTYHERGVFQRK